MIAVVSMALAISITAGLAVAVSYHLHEQADGMASRASIVASGLEFRKFGSSHALLHGMISNDGSEGVVIRSIAILSGSQDACGAGSCELSANFTRNGGSTCRIGGHDGACADCERACMLRPGESLDLGSSLHAVNLGAGTDYIVAVGARTADGIPVTALQSVGVR